MKRIHSFVLLTLAVSLSLLATHVKAEPGRGRPPGRGGGRGKHGGGRGRHEYGKTRCECPDGKVPVEVYESTDTEAPKRTECVTEQICYKICSTNPCETPLQVTCFDKDTFTAGKPGKCPTVACHSKNSKEDDECTADSDCEGQEKCCELDTPTGTVSQCTQPVGTFSDEVDCGTCPESSWRCEENEQTCEVTDPEQCPVGYKCCSCGDVFNCQKPTPP